MPSAAFVFEHLIAAQTRLDEGVAGKSTKASKISKAAAASKAAEAAAAATATAAATSVAKEKKFLSVLKKIVH